MKSGRHLFFCSSTVAVLALASSFALAQGHGNGHGKGHGKNDQGDDDDAPAYTFSDHDRDAMRAWYHDHQNALPPGLAKKDRFLLDWKGNWPNAARCLQVCRNASSLYPWK